MSELVVYEIGYDPTGLDVLKIQAAQSCVRLANDGRRWSYLPVLFC